MLTRVRLKNFKAWIDTGDVHLKPVTMLLGTNSSGKSSLIQSLLLLKQTVLSPDRTVHLNLGGDEASDLFHFGGFDDILNQHVGGERQFSIAFDFNRQSADRISEGQFDSTYVKTGSGGVATQTLTLQTAGRSFSAIRRSRGEYSIVLDQASRPRLKGSEYTPERSIAFSAQAIADLDQDGALVEDLSLAIRREIEGICYLGPLRSKPERDYTWNRTRPGEFGADGRNAVDALLGSALLKDQEAGDILQGVSYWLKRMQVAEKLEVRQQGRASRYELIVHRNGMASNLRDVGIGVSLVVPVLVVAYFARPGSTIILEEPEVHLHPLAQAVLAELFVKVSQERKVQFIVETHSEHLFRRMQTLIARQEVSTGQAAMYFVEHQGQSASLCELALDAFGRLRNWPDGFFGDAMGDTREQARLMLERQKESRS